MVRTLVLRLKETVQTVLQDRNSRRPANLRISVAERASFFDADRPTPLSNQAHEGQVLIFGSDAIVPRPTSETTSPVYALGTSLPAGEADAADCFCDPR